MKKQILLTVLALVPAISFARISDFNAMISENMKEQNQLLGSVKANVSDARDVVDQNDVVVEANTSKRVVIVDQSSTSYVAPTGKEFLAYSKEKKRAKSNDKKQFERVANELNISNE